MKTIAKILIVVSILTLSFQVNAKPRTTLATSNAITYKVLVHLDNHTFSYVRDFFVVISDENGRIVAPPQQLKAGVSEYNFKESGPVKGTRIAKLSNGTRPHSDLFLCNPDGRTGFFLGGDTYTFSLYVILHIVNQDQNPQID